MKKVLLFTDIPPSMNYSGGLVLQQLCSFLSEGALSSVVVMNPQLNPDIPKELSWMEMHCIDKPRDNWGTISGRRVIGETASIVMEGYNSLGVEKKIIDQTLAVAKDFGAEALWCIVEGHSIIRMEHQIARRLNIPLYSLVWDPPGWWLRENRVNRFTAKRTLTRFDDLLRASRATATASWALADKYREIGANTIPLVASLDQAMAYSPAESPHERNEFIITMAGQIYATTEWESLLAALGDMNWQVNGKKIIVRVLSRYATIWANGAANIEFLGWRSQRETLALLAESDILFCPYWFNPEFAQEAQLSYPSKLTSYFAAGRPTLFLGPAYSSPAVLFEKHTIGLGCYSLNRVDIVDAITRLATDQEMYRRLTSNAYKFFCENLTNDVLRSRFYEFLEL